MTFKKGDKVKYADMPAEGIGEVLETSGDKLTVKFPKQGTVVVDQKQTPLVPAPKPKNYKENGVDMEFLAIVISSVLSAIISYVMKSNGFSISILMGILAGIISGKIVHKIYRWQNPRG